MESKKLLYQNGHFYDIITKTRVELKDKAEICIMADSSMFIPVVPAGNPNVKVLTQKEKEEKIISEKNLSRYKKIYSCGDFLYFSIPRKTKNSVTIHEFKVELLEDLYLYLKKSSKSQEEKLFDCTCSVKETTTGTIDFFEEVKAKSLNEAYKSTFVHYFGNKGNPACNALDRFYSKAGNEDSSISRHREH